MLTYASDAGAYFKGMLTYASDAGAYFKELQHLLRLCHYATCGALASFTDDAQVLLVHVVA